MQEQLAAEAAERAWLSAARCTRTNSCAEPCAHGGSTTSSTGCPSCRVPSGQQLGAMAKKLRQQKSFNDQLQQTLGDWRTAVLAKKEAGDVLKCASVVEAYRLCARSAAQDLLERK